jgi:stalled ribosome rescue protein Dom34
MTMNAGVWIDHHKAVVILITDEDEDMLQIMSDRDMPARSLSGARVRNSYTPNDFVAEDKRERKAAIQLNKFYDDVIACLREADAIFVLGPGEAKGEFIKRIDGQKLKGRVVHVGTVDRMTDRQIAAHVRQLIGFGSQHATSTEVPIT